MSSPLVKICGLTDAEGLHAAIEAQADFLGFVFYAPSKRHLSAERAAALVSRVPGHIKTVGLFVDAPDEEIDAVFQHVKLDFLQLHGSEPPERIRDLKSRHGLPVMRAIKVASPQDLVMVGPLQSVADWILFDAKTDEKSSLPGGNGVVFDWQLLKNLKITKPWMLSGGLNAENIEAALAALKPDGIDVSSGVETAPGVKNPDKIRQFIEAVKSF